MKKPIDQMNYGQEPFLKQNSEAIEKTNESNPRAGGESTGHPLSLEAREDHGR